MKMKHQEPDIRHRYLKPINYGFRIGKAENLNLA